MPNKTRQELLTFLKDNPPQAQEFHDSDTIASVLETTLDQYGDPSDEITDSDDCIDDLNETCDSETPVYNSDLLDWLKDHPHALSEYEENFGGLGELIAKDGIYQAIMASYCLTLEAEALQALNTLIEEANAVNA